jgi:hypothetical protein
VGTRECCDLALLLGLRNWRDQVRTDVATLDTVRNARDLRLRERGAQEIEFAGAGVPVPERDAEHGAIVLRDDECAVLAQREISQVPILVEDVGDHSYPFGKTEPNGPRLGPLQAAFGAASENALQEDRVFVLDVLQELIGQFRVGAGKEGIAGSRQGVNVPGPARTASFSDMDQQALALEGGEGLASAAQGDTQLEGNGLRCRVAAALDLLQDTASCFGQAAQGIRHAVIPTQG